MSKDKIRKKNSPSPMDQISIQIPTKTKGKKTISNEDLKKIGWIKDKMTNITTK